MTDRFAMEPVRGIAAPSKDNHIRKRGRVRNKAMKKTKEAKNAMKANSRYDLDFGTEFPQKEQDGKQ